MKQIMIDIRIPDSLDTGTADKVATGIRTVGYSDNSISDQFELLGIMENLKGIIQDKIKKLTDINLKR